MLAGSLFLFLLAATLGTRVLVGKFTDGFHEYEAVFIYASDIFLVAFLILSYSGLARGLRTPPFIPLSWRGGARGSNGGRAHNDPFLFSSLVAFLLFAGISIFLAPAKLLALYQSARLLALVAMAFAVARVAQQKRFFRTILATIAVLAVAQSLIGIAQFVNQNAVGLSWLGESPISVTDGASSKILVGACPAMTESFCGGSRVLRAYGLFPHPNILGAFLILGLLALAYFYLRADTMLYSVIPAPARRSLSEGGKAGIQNLDSRSWSGMTSWGAAFREWWRRGKKFIYLRMMLALAMFVVLLGLTLTFSRAAWLAAIVSVIVLICFQIIGERKWRPALRLLFLLVASGYTLVAILGPFIIPRAAISPGEPAVNLRLAYNRIGLELIRKNPLGVGIGNQVLHSVKNRVYQQFGMGEVWQWQPIHNVYLLMASEVGILGLLTFLVFLGSIIFVNPKFEARSTKQYLNSNAQGSKRFSQFGFRILNLFRVSSLEFRVSAAMLAALLLMAAVDHFPWTIWQGQIMLWLTLGLVMAGRAHSSKPTLDSNQN